MSLVKIAAPIGALVSAGMSAGKVLLKNNVVRNTLIGGGIGAVTGAATAQDGQRLSGAFKGGLIGSTAGGVGTAGFKMYKNMTPAVGPKPTFMGALRSEGASLKNTFSATSDRFKKVTDVLNRKNMKVGTEGRTKLKSADKFRSFMGKPKPGEQGSAMHDDMFNGGQE